LGRGRGTRRAVGLNRVKGGEEQKKERSAFSCYGVRKYEEKARRHCWRLTDLFGKRGKQTLRCINNLGG